MSKLRDKLRATTSAIAAGLGLPALVPKKKSHVVTAKAGKKGTHFRRIIKHETETLIVQTGIRWINGEAQPIMRQVRVHRFYHATKGWRTYHDIVPNIRRAA